MRQHVIHGDSAVVLGHFPDDIREYFEPAKVGHPTVKPAALCAYFIALSTREGETVLDPFCGSGSTGVAAKRMGRAFVGIELDPEEKGFPEIARSRIAAALEVAEPHNPQETLPLEEADEA